MTQSTMIPATPVPAAPRNGFGITALVLALVGLVFGLVPLTGFLALILGMLAVVFVMLGRGRARRGEANNRTMATFGAVLGVLAAVIGVVGISITFNAVDRFGKDLQNIGHDPAAMSDVAASDCSVANEYGITSTRAIVKITNSTNKTQSYMATMGVNGADGARVGEINVVSNSLAAGQSVNLSGVNASGTAMQGIKPGPAACVVANVSRFPS